MQEFNIHLMENKTSLVKVMGEILESGGCIIDTALVIRWESLIDTTPIMRMVGMIRRYVMMNSESW